MVYQMSRTVPVNDDPRQPRLTRSDVWRGLLLKADNALPFVPQMSRCDVLERGDGWLLRDVTVRGEDAREKVSFFPDQRVHFERVLGRTRGTIDNEILEDERGELQLRFAFGLEAEGLPSGSAEERAHFAPMEGDYLNAVNATLAAIRRVVGEQWMRDYYRSVDRMDMDGYLAWHTDDVRFRFGNGPTTTGKAAIREGLDQFWGLIGGLRHEFVCLWDTPEAGIAEAIVVYTRKDGSQVSIPSTTILRKHGNLVQDVRIYMDLAPLFAPQRAEEPTAAVAG